MTFLFLEYRAMERELEAFARTAATYLDPLGVEGIRAAVDSLRDISAIDSIAKMPWTNATWAPIRTTVSEGKFMPGGGGGLDVYADLTFKWEIRNHGKKRRLSPFRYFELQGIASVRVDLFEYKKDANPSPLGMWRFELGCPGHPGCYFHTQILSDKELEAHSLLFPHALDVPRLPGFLFTPVDALEFTLGELFQDEWEERATDQAADMAIWRTYQQARLTSVLDWQRKVIADATGSPWIALKTRKPSPTLIVDPGP